MYIQAGDGLGILGGVGSGLFLLSFFRIFPRTSHTRQLPVDCGGASACRSYGWRLTLFCCVTFCYPKQPASRRGYFFLANAKGLLDTLASLVI